MDQPKQPRGDFYAPVNRYKQPGDSKPIFTGHYTAPVAEKTGDEAQIPFALWAFTYETTNKETGEVTTHTGYSGAVNGVPSNVPAADQIAALIGPGNGATATVKGVDLRPGQVILFENGFKHGSTDKDRPNLYGYINPTDGSPVIEVGVWLRQFEDSKRPYLSGTTQYPLPAKSAATLDAVPDGKAPRQYSMANPPEPWPRPEENAGTNAKAKRGGKGSRE